MKVIRAVSTMDSRAEDRDTEERPGTGWLLTLYVMSQPTQCAYIGLARGHCAPSDPRQSRDPAGLAGERWALPTLLPGGAPMRDRRTVRVHARVWPAELADWRTKAAAVGVPLSDLLRQAMVRTRTWTAGAAEVRARRCRPHEAGNRKSVGVHDKIVVRRAKAPFLSGCESRPATVVCGRLLQRNSR